MNGGTNYVLPEVTECAGYEKLGSVEIRLSNMEFFILYARKLKPDTILSCYGELCNKFKTADGKPPDFEWQEPYPFIFFFVKGNEIYSAESEGFAKLGDYLNAKNTGFLKEEAYNLRNCVSKRDEKINLASLYYDAKRDGYKNFNEFNMSYRFYNDFKPAEEFRKEKHVITKWGFKTKRDWENATVMGFENGEDYYDAAFDEIKSNCEYKDFKILTEKGGEYGITPPYKFHIFHIINRLRGGQAIGLREMNDKLRHESHHCQERWYGKHWEYMEIERLRLILIGKPFSTIGEITNDSGDLVYSLYRNDTIFVDGSNVAWNNGSSEHGDKPYAKNIKAVVNKLKEIGFKNVRVICDHNLYKKVLDKDVYKELSDMGVLDVVQKGTTADLWLIKFREGKDRFIVSNDMFREYLEQHPDLEKHRISFQVSGDEATFDEKIYDIFDGYLPKNELPRLCHQSDDN